MSVHDADKGHVGAIGKARMAFQRRAQRSPVEIEILDEDSALRIPDVQDGAS